MGKPVGRPNIEFNWEEMEKLCIIQATCREIALWFQCHEDTVERAVKKKFGINFAQWVAQKHVKGKVSLRRRQHEVAHNGSVAMLIWLGKQHLGQADKSETVNENLTVHTFKLGFEDDADKAYLAATDVSPKTIERVES